MNEYPTKPLNLSHLEATLSRWLPPESNPTVFGTTADESPADGPRAASIDLAALKGILGEDPGTLREILADFKVSTQRLPADLRAAAALQDTRRIATIAHGFKSASRSTGSSTLGDPLR